MSKAFHGRFFEDFTLGELIRHATPRTISYGDAAIYTALYGSRFVINQSEEFARSVGFPRAPVDDLLVFHMIFGKTVADISLNAIANLGYAECRFQRPVYVGDTILAESEVIGLKENSGGESGIVYVRSTGFNQRDEVIVEFVRWVMVRKGGHKPSAGAPGVPALLGQVEPEALGGGCPRIDAKRWNFDLSGSSHRYSDYRVGEKIDHVDGVTVEEAEHMLAARLYHNTARVHFNAFEEQSGRFGRRIVYGGHVMSIARALSFNGFANGFQIAAINAGRHIAPLFAGGTVFAWSAVKDKAMLKDRDDVAALRIVTTATRDLPAEKFPSTPAGENGPGAILEMDYWVLIPI
ncbi:MAG TPA: MaoC family dehydratase [Aestuariivirgaceae bacterium]|jgi:2-methylfumaryl-CoA hydratase